MSVEPGQRVGALRDADDDTVNLFGYGIYDGVFAIGGMPNPRITLDNGKRVWGMQCWWGPEDRIKEYVNGRTVNIVEPDDLEALIAAEEAADADQG